MAVTTSVVVAFVVAACGGGGEPRPSTVDDVRRAFETEDIRLVEASGARDVWGTVLVAPNEEVRFEVQVFVDAEGARRVADAVRTLADSARTLPRLGDLPARPIPRGRIERRANVVVVVPAAATDELERRITAALGRLRAR